MIAIFAILFSLFAIGILGMQMFPRGRNPVCHWFFDQLHFWCIWLMFGALFSVIFGR